MYFIICQAENRFYHYFIGNQMFSLREIFAKNLKEKRRKCGFSQAKLAEKVGVSTHHIAMIETKRNFPAVDLLERIAIALDVKVYELFLENNSLQIELEQLRKEIKGDIRQLFEEFLSANVNYCRRESRTNVQGQPWNNNQ